MCVSESWSNAVVCFIVNDTKFRLAESPEFFKVSSSLSLPLTHTHALPLSNYAYKHFFCGGSLYIDLDSFQSTRMHNHFHSRVYFRRKWKELPCVWFALLMKIRSRNEQTRSHTHRNTIAFASHTKRNKFHREATANVGCCSTGLWCFVCGCCCCCCWCCCVRSACVCALARSTIALDAVHIASR